jgi:hypothetical protein
VDIQLLKENNRETLIRPILGNRKQDVVLERPSNRHDDNTFNIYSVWGAIVIDFFIWFGVQMFIYTLLGFVIGYMFGEQS